VRPERRSAHLPVREHQRPDRARGVRQKPDAAGPDDRQQDSVAAKAWGSEMTDLAAQFLADAGAAPASAGTPAPSSGATGLAAQFLADAAAAPVPASAAGGTGAAASPSAAGQLIRQLGLTARAGITGVTSLPAMAGDAINAGVNKLFGTHLAPVSQSVQNLENSIGLPQPANGTERVVQDAASAM